MAICEISNGKLIVGIDSRGAELKSIRDAETEKEYMWSADPGYWGKTSPVLFPFVGGLKNGRYRIGEKSYTMEKHGFAKNKEFKLLSHEATEIWFILDADEETRKNYPYDFKLELGYRLEDKTLKVMWRVENPSDETLYFSIGGHPGFKCPLNGEEQRGDYYLKFDAEECIRCTVIGDDGLASDNKVIYELEQGMLPVTVDLFEKDAIVMEDYQIHQISLMTPDKRPYVTVSFDMPVVAVWTPAGVEAPFVCIEPWCGICDHTDFAGTIEERKWGNTVEPGKRFASGYDIRIEE